MSPRAAWRLESLGFTQVFDYVAGKQDWFASGLPREGEQASLARIGDVARRDVPTCRLRDLVGDVRDWVRETGQNVCVVINDQRVVLGVLRGKALDSDPQSPAESVMDPGPSTWRPNVHLQEMVEHMRDHNIQSTLITTSDGRLWGILERADAERLIQEFETAMRAG